VRAVITVLFLTLVSCTMLDEHTASTPDTVHVSDSILASNSKASDLMDTSFITTKKPRCLGMVQEFCQKLFSAAHQGTMDFDVDKYHYEVRLGETSNDFKQTDYDYLSAKTQNWWRLPSDLKDALTARGLLDKIHAYLSRSSRQSMSLSDRIKNMRSEEEIDSMWTSAMRETVLVRMEKRFPGYSKIKEDYIPIELHYETQRQTKLLEAEVARAIWGHHKNWQKVEIKFERVRQAYKEVVAGLAGLPESVRKEWLGRLDSIKLIIPGSDPEIDSEACMKDENNAYFYSDRNELTVCAGDFNTEEIGQTLAHEIGHALDIDRTRFLFQDASAEGKAFHMLKDMNCGRKTLDCSFWNAHKKQYASNLRELEKFPPQLESFNLCLQDKRLRTDMTDEYLSRVSREEVEAVAADLAERNVFLRLISPRIPLPDGSSQINPMYLNPCGYYLWDNQSYPLDEDVSMLLFFTTEYRCSKETDRDKKFKNAIDMAQDMQTDLTRSRLKIEGEFSGNERLVIDGYSVPPAEKFADAVGMKVFSHILSEDDTNINRRRARYLVNNAWLCRKPSLQQLYPSEARIQKSYFSEPHSEHSQRQKELLSTEVREAIDCELDFEPRECKIN
jgi:hypothetical protein